MTTPADRVVSSQEQAGEWLDDHAAEVAEALAQAAAEFPAGLDFDGGHRVEEVAVAGQPVRVAVRSMRVADARSLAENLVELARELTASGVRELRACPLG